MSQTSQETRTWLSKKTMSPDELRTFFKDYCKRWNFTMKDAREYRIWWAMFFTWKEGGWWTEDEKKDPMMVPSREARP